MPISIASQVAMRGIVTVGAGIRVGRGVLVKTMRESVGAGVEVEKTGIESTGLAVHAESATMINSSRSLPTILMNMNEYTTLTQQVPVIAKMAS